ncbi:MAG: transposase [Pseudomonadota bacterium]
MPWDDIARANYAPRYAGDPMGREWALIVPFMRDQRCLGRPCTTDLREVMKATLSIASTGCRRRYLPTAFPPVSTGQRYVCR